MTWKPHVTVAAIAQQQDKFLMVEEHIDGRLLFNQPAGHLEHDESLIQAVIRETLEETAWHFRPTALTGIYRWCKPQSDRSYLRFCFSGECVQHEPDRALDQDIHRALWLSVEDIERKQAHLRSPMVLRCLHDYLAGTRLPLSILTEIT